MNAVVRKILASVLIILGPTLLVFSPWFVLSFGPIHRRVYDEGWLCSITGPCIWFSELRESAALTWLTGIIVLGVVALFAGIWLFRSTFHFRS